MSKYLILSSALFCIGLYGVMARRNLLIILMSIELMLNSVNLAAVGFARHSRTVDGLVMFLIILASAAAEVAVGLSILISLFRTRRSVDTADAASLRG